jgi:endo-1,4-beta-xylanase
MLPGPLRVSCFIVVLALAGCAGDMVGREASRVVERRVPAGAVNSRPSGTSSGDSGDGAIGDSGTTETPSVPSALRRAAEAAGILVGAAVSAAHLDDAMYRAAVAREFNYVTAENEMKWAATEPRRGELSFTAGDRIVLFAEAHGMKVKGHNLLWPSRLPGWALADTDARLAMAAHIGEVVGHYKGHVVAWDVVNEAIDDDPTHSLRIDGWLKQIGDTYVDQAFTIAHKADPAALLFYNDYGIESAAPRSKGEAMLKLVTRLLKAGVPIHGVGFQTHIAAQGGPATTDFADILKRVTDLGLLVNISELDANVCGVPGSVTDKFNVQKTRFHDITAACVALGRKCHAVTVWGVVDKYSWLNDFAPCGQGETGRPWPLLLDDEYAEKPAWAGVLEALSKR